MRGELFHDTSATDATLRITSLGRRPREVVTAPFGGFLLVLR